MNDPIPDSLRYTDGRYVFERRPGLDTTAAPLAERRRFASALHAVHRPWFAIRVPRGVGVLTTIGRKSGSPRVTYVKAVRDGERTYLVAITRHTLWVKNIQANPQVRLRLPRKPVSPQGLSIETQDPRIASGVVRGWGAAHRRTHHPSVTSPRNIH
ncbi:MULTISPECIES: nitroreductase family deazaflavin-dependent oxidoreductase [unclassified Mycobacteroides]|uniref:nitroreductase family deazaflavin-dependent oxidoreductase n=1 Tax=unclassified Mycobacteroides TaxID=2618759 RepID=UPI001327EB16|nr:MULTISPECIES: nitroreductase family deazaflavin-dependent oxidoreductase [unclassified Mycobacteroides]MUM18288.1 hypothetical protein [Mycobacteroides sp. CBMA 326]